MDVARTRGDSQGRAARQRLIEAFWELLAEVPYHKMSALMVAKRACVNRNTLYYHFEGLDCLARHAVDELLLPDLLLSVLKSGDASKLGEAMRSPDMKLRIDRMALVLGSNSSNALIGTFRESTFNAWCDSFGIDPTRLAEKDWLVVDFALSGVAAAAARVLRSNNVAGCAEAFFATGLPADIYKRLKLLSADENAR